MALCRKKVQVQVSSSFPFVIRAFSNSSLGKNSVAGFPLAKFTVSSRCLLLIACYLSMLVVVEIWWHLGVYLLCLWGGLALSGWAV